MDQQRKFVSNLNGADTRIVHRGSSLFERRFLWFVATLATAVWTTFLANGLLAQNVPQLRWTAPATQISPNSVVTVPVTIQFSVPVVVPVTEHGRKAVATVSDEAPQSRQDVSQEPSADDQRVATELDTLLQLRKNLGGGLSSQMSGLFQPEEMEQEFRRQLSSLVANGHAQGESAPASPPTRLATELPAQVHLTDDRQINNRDHSMLQPAPVPNLNRSQKAVPQPSSDVRQPNRFQDHSESHLLPLVPPDHGNIPNSKRQTLSDQSVFQSPPLQHPQAVDDCSANPKVDAESHHFAPVTAENPHNVATTVAQGPQGGSPSTNVTPYPAFPSPTNHPLPAAPQNGPRLALLPRAPTQTQLLLLVPQGPFPDHPDNQHPNNQHPNNQHPNNQHPNNQHPNNQHPNNQHPNNQHPNNQLPNVPFQTVPDPNHPIPNGPIAHPPRLNGNLGPVPNGLPYGLQTGPAPNSDPHGPVPYGLVRTPEPPAWRVVSDAMSPQPSAPYSRPSTPRDVSQIRRIARQLDELAADLEESQNFASADALRSEAQKIRLMCR